MTCRERGVQEQSSVFIWWVHGWGGGTLHPPQRTPRMERRRSSSSYVQGIIHQNAISKTLRKMCPKLTFPRGCLRTIYMWKDGTRASLEDRIHVFKFTKITSWSSHHKFWSQKTWNKLVVFYKDHLFEKKRDVIWYVGIVITIDWWKVPSIMRSSSEQFSHNVSWDWAFHERKISHEM